MTALEAEDRYTIISADCHAGGSHAAYREYLDPSTSRTSTPGAASTRTRTRTSATTAALRNWDNEMRNAQQEADGVVGEVVFPNTVPPFFPSFVLFAGPPTDERVRAPPRRHPGPQPLARRLVRRVPRAPGRHRPDLPQRRRRRHRRRHVDQGARPARRHPPAEHRARREVGEAALRPGATTRCGRCARTSRSRSTCTAAPARPTTGAYPVSMLLYITEVRFYSQRPFVHMLLSGVFERFPRLKFVMTEAGLRLGAAAARAARRHDPRASATPARPARSATARTTCCRATATEYFHQNCWMGVSQPGPRRRRGPPRARRSTGSCGAATTRTTRAPTRTPASTCAHGSTTCPRPSCADCSPATRRSSTASTSTKLAPLAAKFGPTVDEIADAARRDPEQDPRAPLRRHGPEGDQVSRLRRRRSVDDPGAARPAHHPEPAREAQRAQPPAARRAPRRARGPTTTTPTCG